jgi:predicted RNA binding protein YcfA (HicA-like mRNA interferase family)
VTKLPMVTYRDMDAVLRRLGFTAIRQRGSHVLYRHADRRTTTVPRHAGRDLAAPLVRVILHEIRIGPEEFARLMNEG